MENFVKISIGRDSKHGFAVVDKEDGELSNKKWYLTPNGYVYSSTQKGKVSLHRTIMGARKGEIVDHIDGNKLNCRRANLRICTQAENAKNQMTRSTNTSGYKGVYMHTTSKKFVARIKLNYKYYHLGCYSTAEEAAQVYNNAASEYHGEFARLNDVR